MIAQMIPQAPKPLIRARNIYLLLIVLTVIAGGVFGFKQGTEFLSKRDNIQQNEAVAEVLNGEIDNIEKKFSETQKVFEIEKQKYEEAAFKILPDEEKFIDITKSLDNFFDKNFQKGSEIVASSLRFGAGVKAQDRPYSILPFSLTITASKEKFEKFLKFMENSGAFDAAQAGALNARLFSLQAIRLNLNAGDAEDQVSFTVDLSAFYRDAVKKQAPAAISS